MIIHLIIVIGAILPRIPCLDLTLLAKETGSDVVDAVVDRISMSCIFENDKLMLRRLAQVETNDGTALVSSGNYDGGIWKITQGDHIIVRTRGFQFFAPVQQHLNIDISKAMYTDYEKPLYSGIAASIKLAIKTAGSGIPWGCIDQASTWTDVYIPGAANADKQTYIDLCGSQEACDVSKADIVIAMDESGSITSSNFDIVKQFVVDLVGAFHLTSSGVRMGIIKYSTDTTTVVGLGALPSTVDVQRQVLDTMYSSGGTRTDRALLKMREMLLSGHGAQGVPQIAIIITDGKSNEAAALAQAVSVVNGDPFTIFSVGVTSGADITELQTYGSDPDCLHVYTIGNFTEMTYFVQQIQQLACTAPAELSANLKVEGDIEHEEVIFFKLVVQKTEKGVTIKLKMQSGICKMYLSFKVRNPGPAIYDYIQEVTSTSVEGGWIYIPWPADALVTETYLYVALEGGVGGLGVGNHYVMEYTNGDFNASGFHNINLVMLVLVMLGLWAL